MEAQRLLFATVAVCAMAACTGVIGGDDRGGDPSGTGSTPLTCDEASKVPAPTPFPRLTARQYTTTVAALFPEVTLPTLDLPLDGSATTLFENDALAQTISATHVEKYQAAAKVVAAAAVSSLSKVVGCDPKDDACAHAFVQKFLQRAYRHPAADEDVASTDALFDAAKAKWDATVATRMVIEAVLQSPEFLYRVESAPSDKVAEYAPHELAARLSYFLWDGPPDDALTTAAADGSLLRDDVLEAQARRLLADPRAHAAVASFHRQWLGLDKIDRLSKSSTVFPDFTSQTPASLRTSMEKWVDGQFWEKGSFTSLLTEPTAYVDATIAPIFGVPAPAAGEWKKVDLDPSQRAGLLTQAGLMASLAHETSEAPVLRGVWVLRQVLCEPIAPPPPGVNTSVIEPMPGEAPKTMRDRLNETHVSASCKGCHTVIDDVGFGFQAYDGVGKWRAKEAGAPVNATGNVSGAGDADGAFDGAIQLSQRLAKSARVQGCFAGKWYGYALARSPQDGDACAVDDLGKAFAASGGDMKELLVSIVKSAAFRKHRAEEAK